MINTHEQKIILDLTNKFSKVNSRKNGDVRSPHKIFLILLILSRYSKKEISDVRFEEIKNPLISLLENYGPPSKKQKPNDPFWHLKNDGVWKLKAGSELFIDRNNNNAPTNNQLKDVTGNFSKEIQNDLIKNPTIASQVAENLITNLFPQTFHNDLKDFLGLELPENIVQIKKVRDPKFRLLVLEAYEYKCVVCGFNLRLNDKLVGLEGAHIKWHEYNGSDEVDNGFSMCSLHHTLFDRGVFTLDKESLMWVFSTSVDGSSLDLQKNYHQKQAPKPIYEFHRPRKEYLEWHEKNVFKPSKRP